jgi:hypothetical protein
MLGDEGGPRIASSLGATSCLEVRNASDNLTRVATRGLGMGVLRSHSLFNCHTSMLWTCGCPCTAFPWLNPKLPTIAKAVCVLVFAFCLVRNWPIGRPHLPHRSCSYSMSCMVGPFGAIPPCSSLETNDDRGPRAGRTQQKVSTTLPR